MTGSDRVGTTRIAKSASINSKPVSLPTEVDNFCGPTSEVDPSWQGDSSRCQPDDARHPAGPVTDGHRTCDRRGMKSVTALGCAETSRTTGLCAFTLPAPPSAWPHLRKAATATWQSRFTFHGSSSAPGLFLGVGRPVRGRTALVRDRHPAHLAHDDAWSGTWPDADWLRQQPLSTAGRERQRRADKLRPAALASEAADDQPAWQATAQWDGSSSAASQNGAGTRGTAVAERADGGGGPDASAAREVVTPGSAADLLRSTLNAIEVLQSPFKATATLEEDNGHDDSLHIEHGLASSSVGRAVYEVRRALPHDACCSQPGVSQPAV